jgi:hypothetical protein
MGEVNEPSLVTRVYACLPVQLLNQCPNFTKLNTHIVIMPTLLFLIYLSIIIIITAQTCEPSKWGSMSATHFGFFICFVMELAKQ